MIRRGIGLVIMLGFLAGCASMVDNVARAYGYKGDPTPGPCTQASVAAGKCVAQGGK